ncbi:MAG TPA: alpha-hydroxy acid oxidase [Opitutaceae bacterium]
MDRIPTEVVAVSDYEPLAKERMSEFAWAYTSGGAADEITLRWNREAFDRVRLCGRVLESVAGGNTRVALFGSTFEFPILLGPVAYQKLAHPEGELATVRGASAAKAGLVVSTVASTSLEEIADASDTPLWFQLYVQPDRSFTRDLIGRAEVAGYKALVVTVDTPIDGARNRQERAGFYGSPQLVAPNLLGLKPSQLVPAGTGGNLVFGSGLLESAPTWKDIESFLSTTTLPLIIKGVMAPRDAVRAADMGCAGVVVSNHGARNLDTLPATIDVLPRIANAVAGRIPLLLDGGIRRGSDILKALALGAKAVLIGRPYVCALATAGAIGVAHVVNILRAELEAAMVLTGCATIDQIDRSVVWED